MTTWTRRIRVGLVAGWVLVFCGVTGGDVVGAEPQAAAPAPVKDLYALAGVQGGLVVHVGCADGKLTAGLRVAPRFLVQGLDTNADNVAVARAHIESRGLSGSVTAVLWDGKQLPYVDNLVNLLVVEQAGAMPRAEMLRALAPQGVALIREGGQWRRIVKPRPTDIDEWTHFLHDPTNNAVARDTRVASPKHVQWVSGPARGRTHDHLASLSIAVSAQGRLFSIIDEGPPGSILAPARWALVAQDAFNGVHLWKRPIPLWEPHLRTFRTGPSHVHRRLVAVEDKVFVTLGYGQPVSQLDAATGEAVHAYAGTEGAEEILCSDGVLYLVIGDAALQRKTATGTIKLGDEAYRVPPKTAAVRQRIEAIRAEDGKVLWTVADLDGEIMPLSLSVHAGRVCYQTTDSLNCLAADSGKSVWRTPRRTGIVRGGGVSSTLVLQEDVVLLADRTAPEKDNAPKPVGRRFVTWLDPYSANYGGKAVLEAYSLRDGKRLWSTDTHEGFRSPPDVFVTGGMVWSGNTHKPGTPGIREARDLHTGKVRRTRPEDKKFFPSFGHHLCYRNKATSRFLLIGRNAVHFIDLASGEAISDFWIRGTCQFGLLPCNGMLYTPPNACACYQGSRLNGYVAYTAVRAPIGQAAPRLVRGPAYGKVDTAAPAAGDWPTYRRDASRSGSASAGVGGDLSVAWQAKLGGKLSAPVIAGRRVFVAQVDAHRLVALDADGGKALWTFTAGGRIDSPPTCAGDVVLVGSADGYVACLLATDGALVWRFRAAPAERSLVADGQVESVWPVHGSVLVLTEPSSRGAGKSRAVAYVTAGRSSYTDGGISLIKLDATTGQLLAERRITHRDPKTDRQPIAGHVKHPDMPGALSDVLSADETRIFLRRNAYARADLSDAPRTHHLFSQAGFLEDAWFHRMYWMFGDHTIGGYGQWPQAARRFASGRMLVMDDRHIYGYGRSTHAVRKGAHPEMFGVQYRLFAAPKTAPQASAPARRGKGKPAATPKPVWTANEPPVFARAMVLAGEELIVAGPPAVAPAQFDESLVGKSGGLLHVYAAQDGRLLRQRKLDSPPAWDGLAAAGGRLYLATADGRVVCFR